MLKIEKQIREITLHVNSHLDDEIEEARNIESVLKQIVEDVEDVESSGVDLNVFYERMVANVAKKKAEKARL